MSCWLRCVQQFPRYDYRSFRTSRTLLANGRELFCSAQSQMQRNGFFTESRKRYDLPIIARGLVRLVKEPIKSFTMAKNGKHIDRRVWNLLDLNIKPRNEAGVLSMDVVIDQAKGVWARLYIPHFAPAGHHSLPVIFHFHGGGFATLRASSVFYDHYCKNLCSKGRVVISVDYRRSPEHPYPAAYHDCFSALLWLHKQVMRDINPKASTLEFPNIPAPMKIWVNPHLQGMPYPYAYSAHDASTVESHVANGKETMGKSKLLDLHLSEFCDLSRCFLLGDSAGGNIVHHVASMAATAGCYLTPLRIVGCMLLFPFFGGEQRTRSELQLARHFLLDLGSCDWLWKAFLPENSNRDHPACNVPQALYAHMGTSSDKHPIQDLLTPWFVAVAEHDPLRDRQLEYANALQKGNKLVDLHYYKGGFHCFHLFGRHVSLTRELRAHAESFIRVHSI